MGIFVKPVTQEFGWSRSVVTSAFSLGMFLGGAIALAVGPALDRFGPRWILSIAFLIVGGSLALFGFINSLWQFYLAMVLGRVAVQGAINLSISVTASQWFQRKRGRAIALSRLGLPVGNGVLPLYTQAFISGSNWRTAAFALCSITLAIGLAPSLLFLRRRPEDLGLGPDGDPLRPQLTNVESACGQRKPGSNGEVSMRLRQVLKTRVFYMLLLTTAVFNFVTAGVNVHALAYVDDRGLAPATAALVIALGFFLSVAGSLVGGFAAERISLRSALAFTYFASALSVLLLVQMHSVPVAFSYAVVFGISFGTLSTLVQLSIPTYFGHRSFGTIRGFMLPLLLGANALGPLVAAVAFDAANSYVPVFLGFLGLYVLSGATSLLMPPSLSTPR